MNERTIFLAALDIDDPAGRSAYLDKACAGDPGLRRRLDELLRSHDRAGAFLAKPAAEVMAAADGTAALDATDAPPGAVPGPPQAEVRGVVDEASALAVLEPPGRPGALGRLGHYEVLEVLGRGAFGVVFKALDETLQRLVAIKVLPPELAAGATARRRFLREARAAAAVRHEHVIDIHAIHEQPVPYLVMEYVEGRTLQDKLDAGGPLRPGDVLRIGYQVANGLAAAHRRGLIHRDIKPANILLEDEAERVKITDFGLARAFDDTSLTQSGMVAGTPAYMAPEQAVGERLDQRTDLFSLGSVLYAMCTGRAAFTGDSNLSVLKHVMEDAPRPVRELNPAIPAWLAEVIARLHAKDRAKRYQSAQELADVLARHLAQTPLPGDTAPSLSAVEAVEYRAKNQQGSGRSRRLLAAGGAAVVVVAVIAAIVYLNRDRDHAPPDRAVPGVLATSGSDSGPPPVKGPPPRAIAPFGAKAAEAHQEAWANYLGLPVQITNALGMKFRIIPPGQFVTSAERRVTLSKPFALGIHEVTVAQFRAFVDATGYRTDAEASGQGGVVSINGKDEQKPEFIWRHPTVAHGDDFPVAQVSWNDAVAFCKWLSGKEGKTYRLPTEAEWEWACRAGTTTKYSFGDDARELGEYAWFRDNADGKSHPVGGKRPNAWGLFDMHGNVAEYCTDRYGELPAVDETDPKGPGRGDLRVLRSHAFHDGAGAVTSHSRAATTEGISLWIFGFRVAVELRD
jgi:serine/threonine protein kinase/formylglycine-generating enzyme required for sulfatase activity